MADRRATDGLRPRHLVRVVVLFGLLAVASVIAAALFGPTGLDVPRFLRGEGSALDHFKVFEVRLPKALAALLVGSALSAAGATFQALLHNPLASPYILGVSAAGSLGAVIALLTGAVSLLFPAAFVGCLFAIALVLFVSRRNGVIDPHTLLLTGVVVNAFFSACILFLTLMSPDSRTQHVLHWLVGGLRDLYDPALLLVASGVIMALLLALVFLGRALNVLLLGEDAAAGLGVPVHRLRLWCFLLASFLTAVAVSLAGPIGFVGLIIPHIARAMVGPDHRVLIPAAALLGGAFLVVADTAGSSLFATPLPVGVLTAFLGAPFFVWILKRGPSFGGRSP
ncbi:MAG TPA: iron ABC transporter permease [Planctomycetota bacterium]|nr:iron ABC transporter permease [Planctomycetota bacterium]